jgi:hypothetical protein
LPVSYLAFREGRLSLDQMYTIARRVPARFDEQACELAVMCTPSQLDRLFKRYPWPEPLTGEERQSGKVRDTTTHFDDDGDLWLRACLPAEQGVVVDTALRAHYDALMHDWLAEKTIAERTGNGFTTPKPTWSDALERMAVRSLEAEAAERSGSWRVQTILHVDLDTLVAQAHLGPALPDAVRRSLTCDSTFRILYERAGVALGVGRQSRDIPERTRMAVEHRDGGCRVPGCTARVVQIHHVKHWEDGGPTDTANLIAVCPAHHRMHHRGELGIEGSDADRRDGISFLTASGCPSVGSGHRYRRRQEIHRRCRATTSTRSGSDCTSN